MTLAVTIRPPTARETAWIDRQWSKDLQLSSAVPGRRSGVPVNAQFSGEMNGEFRSWERGDGFWMTPDPSRLVSPRMYRAAVRLWVRETLAKCRLMVAELEEVPDEPVGWVAFSDDGLELFYVRVIGDCRRQGIGTALIEACGARVPAYLTFEGAMLLQSVNDRPRAVAQGDDDGRPDEDRSEGMAVVAG